MSQGIPAAVFPVSLQKEKLQKGKGQRWYSEGCSQKNQNEFSSINSSW